MRRGYLQGHRQLMGSYTAEELPSLPAIVNPTVYISLGWERPSEQASLLPIHRGILVGSIF